MVRKNHKHHWVVFTLVAVILLILLIGCAQSQQSSLHPLKVKLLKVGKADAIILQSNAEVLVIDTGEEDDGEELVSYLLNQGISQVDALIITHFDQDHVGGADTLIEQMPVKQIYVPDYMGTHTEYADFISAMEGKGIVPTALREPVQFMLGDAQVLIEPPVSYEVDPNTVENDNNFSLITTVVHGDNRLLFMGDAEKQRIREWLGSASAVDCNFLKVPHHGVYNSALPELLDSISPEYSVICSSQKNPAEAKTVALLKQHGSSIFETKDGNVTVISDGQHLEIKQKTKY